MTLLTFLDTFGKLATETYSEFVPFQPDRPPSALEREYANEHSHFLEVGNARMHYRDDGPRDAKTIVAVHGAYSSLHTWEGWAATLADEYRLVSVDMPGHGLTGPLRGESHRLSSLVNHVEALCDELELENFALVGNSLGGAVSWRIAIKRPELLSHLVLINAGGATLLSSQAENLVSFGTDVIPRYFTPRMLVRLILMDAYADNSLVTEDLVRRYHDLLCRTGNRRAVIEICRNYMEDHFDDEDHESLGTGLPTLPSMNGQDPEPSAWDEYEMEEVGVPTLFQWGEEDLWLPLSFGRAFADHVEGSTFLTYENVGHVPMEELPVESAADAASFISD